MERNPYYHIEVEEAIIGALIFRRRVDQRMYLKTGALLFSAVTKNLYPDAAISRKRDSD